MENSTVNPLNFLSIDRYTVVSEAVQLLPLYLSQRNTIN